MACRRAGLLLSVTAFAIPAGALYAVGYVMCLALGAGKSLLRVSALNLILFIPIMIFARSWGLVGLAICWRRIAIFHRNTVVSRATGRVGAAWRPSGGRLSDSCCRGSFRRRHDRDATLDIRSFAQTHWLDSCLRRWRRGVWAGPPSTKRETLFYVLRMAQGSRDPITPRSLVPMRIRLTPLA